jgi:hypothetical protein
MWTKFSLYWTALIFYFVYGKLLKTVTPSCAFCVGNKTVRFVRITICRYCLSLIVVFYIKTERRWKDIVLISTMHIDALFQFSTRHASQFTPLFEVMNYVKKFSCIVKHASMSSLFLFFYHTGVLLNWN